MWGVYRTVPDLPSRMEPQRPMALTCLITHPLLVAFHASPPTPLQGPRITFQNELPALTLLSQDLLLGKPYLKKVGRILPARGAGTAENLTSAGFH